MSASALPAANAGSKALLSCDVGKCEVEPLLPHLAHTGGGPGGRPSTPLANLQILFLARGGHAFPWLWRRSVAGALLEGFAGRSDFGFPFSLDCLWRRLDISAYIEERSSSYSLMKGYWALWEEKGTKKTGRMTAIEIMVKFPPGSRIYKYAKHMLQTWQHRSLEELLEDARDELMVFESVCKEPKHWLTVDPSYEGDNEQNALAPKRVVDPLKHILIELSVEGTEAKRELLRKNGWTGRWGKDGMQQRPGRIMRSKCLVLTSGVREDIILNLWRRKKDAPVEYHLQEEYDDEEEKNLRQRRLRQQVAVPGGRPLEFDLGLSKADARPTSDDTEDLGRQRLVPASALLPLADAFTRHLKLLETLAFEESAAGSTRLLSSHLQVLAGGLLRLWLLEAQKFLGSTADATLPHAGAAGVGGGLSGSQETRALLALLEDHGVEQRVLTQDAKLLMEDSIAH
ncbi:hypothetical protein AK812_SmicGene6306 [Symbiodinium microadriaticum]|uniref:Uncharacterized protein n=1 Tax=Symbiodinium microadriaticum TaxID=2951 RepID=A0A1Q9ERG3_SYMMI|nr:hypothetical protein AK812_SmicGene6306 [Symbiodinium microadriaticum]